MARKKTARRKMGTRVGTKKREGRGAVSAIASPATRGLYHPCMTAGQMNQMRDLFWCNVVRDMLNGLSVLSQQQPEIFDGRFGLLTRRGERIGVASVMPLFACSIPGSPEEKDASVAVQCTVFQVTTPDGEVFTLPVHEVRAVHTMTPELLERLQKLAEKEDGDGEDQPSRPFGLAAFAALPKPPQPTGPGMTEGLGE